jgi:hypothetical protein
MRVEQSPDCWAKVSGRREAGAPTGVYLFIIYYLLLERLQQVFIKFIDCFVISIHSSIFWFHKLFATRQT